MPDLCLQIEAKDIAEGSTSVVETTVATIDVHLAVVISVTHVSTWRGCTDRRLLVCGNVAATFNSLPVNLGVVDVGNLKDPTVIEALGRASVTTENEDFLLGGQDSGMLGTGHGVLVTLSNFLVPMAVLYLNKMNKIRYLL